MKPIKRIQIAIIKAGLQNELIAAQIYAPFTKHPICLYIHLVLFLSSWGSWLDVSPDRWVYDLQIGLRFGLIEIRHPEMRTVLEVIS